MGFLEQTRATQFLAELGPLVLGGLRCFKDALFAGALNRVGNEVDLDVD